MGMVRLPPTEDTRLGRTLLKAIDSLCVGLCKGCTSYEIIPVIAKEGYERDAYSVAQRLVALRDAGLVKSVTADHFQLWSLTPKGRQWLKQK